MLLWCFDSGPVVLPCCFRGASVVRPWRLRAAYVLVLLWCLHGVAVWCFCGASMVHPKGTQRSHGASIVVLRCLHGSSMVVFRGAFMGPLDSMRLS